MITGILVYKRSLKIGRVMPGVLHRGEDHVVKKKCALLHVGNRETHLVHSLFGFPRHIPVERYPCPSPALEVQSIFKVRRYPALFQELYLEGIVWDRLGGIDPEHERGDPRVGIGTRGNVIDCLTDAPIGIGTVPRPFKTVFPVLVMIR